MNPDSLRDLDRLGAPASPPASANSASLSAPGLQVGVDVTHHLLKIRADDLPRDAGPPMLRSRAANCSAASLQAL
jgi:hypothetical protein